MAKRAYFANYPEEVAEVMTTEVEPVQEHIPEDEFDDEDDGPLVSFRVIIGAAFSTALVTLLIFCNIFVKTTRK